MDFREQNTWNPSFEGGMDYTPEVIPDDIIEGNHLLAGKIENQFKILKWK